LIVWVSNYDYSPSSGIVNPIYIGTPEGITKLKNLASTNDFVGITSLLIIGLLFFAIFIFRRNSVYLLYFSIFCFSSVIFLATHGEKLLNVLLPAMDYRLFARLQYFSASIFILMLLLYLYYSFPQLFKGKITKALIIIALALIPVCFLAPISIQSVWSHNATNTFYI
jgi:two-component system, sensor histidine kinase ChiS